MSNQLTRIEYEYQVFTDPELLHKITRHVSNGGSMIELAGMIGVRYCDLVGWIREDKERSELYEKALSDRKEWARERVLQELANISYDYSEEIEGRPVKAKTSDRLKALEMIAKNLSLLTEKHEVSGKVTLDQLIMATQLKKSE